MLACLVVTVVLLASVWCTMMLAPPAVAAVVDVVLAMDVGLPSSLPSLQMVYCMTDLALPVLVKQFGKRPRAPTVKQEHAVLTVVLPALVVLSTVCMVVAVVYMRWKAM